MNTFSNILDPAILFFFLGIGASLLRSNLEIPQPIGKFLSLYLLLAIGFKGGVELSQSGFSGNIILTFAVAICMALLVPVYSFFILKQKLNIYDAAGVAATYGSVSAVTFITATVFLEKHGLHFGGYMAAVLAIMESPAIIVALCLSNWIRKHDLKKKDGELGSLPPQMRIRDILKDAFTDGAHMLLLGSIVIGIITGHHGQEMVNPLIKDLFKGLLCFFLLDMGLLVAKRLRDIRKVGLFLASFGIIIPIINASVVAVIGRFLGLELGDTFMLSVMAASASYIVVPAAVRHAIPEANPTLYFGSSLAVTFPFNVMIGIPLYFSLISWLWSIPL
jgi:hypothetical protein